MLMIIICDFISLFLLDYIAKSVMEKRFERSIHKIVFCMFFIIICFLNYNGATSLKALLLLLFYCLYISVQYVGIVLKKLLCIIPFFTFQILSEILMGFILSDIFLMKVSSDIHSDSFILGLIFSYLFLCIFTVLFVKFYKYINQKKLPIYSWMIFILPILTIIILTSVDDYFSIFDSGYGYFTFILIMAISNGSLIVIFFLVFQANNYKKELEITNYSHQITNMKYSLLKQHYDYNFSYLHDLLHCYTEINKFLENSDYEQVRKCFDNLTNTIYQEFNSIYSNSITMNYVVNNVLHELADHSIQCRTVFEYNEFQDFDFDKQITLFGYLVELGISEAKKVNEEKRVIKVKSKLILNRPTIHVAFPINDLDYIKEIKKEIEAILDNIDHQLNIAIEDGFISIIIQFGV